MTKNSDKIAQDWCFDLLSVVTPRKQLRWGYIRRSSRYSHSLLTPGSSRWLLDANRHHRRSRRFDVLGCLLCVCQHRQDLLVSEVVEDNCQDFERPKYSKLKTSRLTTCCFNLLCNDQLLCWGVDRRTWVSVRSGFGVGWRSRRRRQGRHRRRRLRRQRQRRRWRWRRRWRRQSLFGSSSSSTSSWCPGVSGRMNPDGLGPDAGGVDWCWWWCWGRLLRQTWRSPAALRQQRSFVVEFDPSSGWAGFEPANTFPAAPTVGEFARSQKGFSTQSRRKVFVLAFYLNKVPNKRVLQSCCFQDKKAPMGKSFSVTNKVDTVVTTSQNGL